MRGLKNKSKKEQIVATIKTSSEIVEQNKIQLQWLDKGLGLAKRRVRNGRKKILIKVMYENALVISLSNSRYGLCIVRYLFSRKENNQKG